jgi:hypothetical protein
MILTPTIKPKFGIAAICFGIASSFTFVNPLCVSAAEITINDCDGITRAQIELADQTERKDITIGLTNPGLDSKVNNIFLKSGSELVTSEANNGEVFFSNLNSGTYEVCPELSTTKISTISFKDAQQSVTQSVGTASLGAAAIGGSIIALSSTGSGSSDKNAVNAGNGTVLNQNTDVTTVSPGRPSSPPPTSEAATACLNGQQVRPLSPFL